MLSYKIYIYTPIIVLLFRISAIFMEIVESTPQITTTGSLEGGMLKQVKYEDSDHTATDDDYSDGLRSGFDSNPAPVRTLGVIQSDDISFLDQVRNIMYMLENVSASFSAVSLHNYGSEDSYSFKKVVRSLQAVQPAAVIGTYSWPYAVAAEHLRIPYFITTQVPLNHKESPFLIQLFPYPEVFARAAEDILRYYNLNKAIVFHDSVAGQIILEKLTQKSWMEVTSFFVNSRTINSVREQLKIVRSKYYTTFIGVLNASNTGQLLDMGQSLSMFSAPHKWLLINMDLQEYSLDNYVDSHANITVLSLMVDYSSSFCFLSKEYINLKRAVLHDAIILHANISRETEMLKHKNVRVSMRDIVRNLESDGCTGRLKFTSSATRTESFLQIVTLEGYKAGTTGTWRSLPLDLKRRVEPWRSFSSVSQVSENVFGDQPLRITFKEEEPFIMKKKDKGFDPTGHPDFEGFLTDILLEMVKLLNFKYILSEVPDKKYGSLKKDGWTGMIRHLVDNKTDIALAPFQMSTQRAEVVDFTKPFMTKGTTVVVRRPEPNFWIFQFLSPFSGIVWSTIFVAFVGTSLMLFAVSRFNSDKQAKYTSNLRESFWYMWGTLLRGSLNGSPHAVSSRIISSAWWFFCLILSSIYTANLAAFLTITNGDIGINTAQDLALQDHFDYGTVEGSQTETFFSHTRMTYYSRMWAHMSVLSPKSMSRTTEIGFERVRNGKYAFIWDSPTIRYEISNDCNLMEIGSPFDLKGYGFAYQKNAPYGDKLSWALLKLQDDGVLYRLERKTARKMFMFLAVDRAKMLKHNVVPDGSVLRSLFLQNLSEPKTQGKMHYIINRFFDLWIVTILATFSRLILLLEEQIQSWDTILVSYGSPSLMPPVSQGWWRPQICPSHQQSATTQSLELKTVAGMYVVILSGAIVSSLMCLLQYCYNHLRRKQKSRTSRKNEGSRINNHRADGVVNRLKSSHRKPNKHQTCEVNVDEITYANHSPRHFGASEEWT